MNERIAYLSQIVDKIGAPLLLSILENAARGGHAKNPETLKEEAQKLAELLSRTVMLSIDLGKMIEIEKSEPEYTESLRVAMAGLASPIVGKQYLRLKKPPTEGDLKKVSSALEAVLAFADNFSPSPENALRLNLLNASATPTDAHQVTIQYLQAFVPVADVIAAFPFGQSERKLMQDTAERINSRAKGMVEYIFGDSINDDQKKLSELAFVRALADLYSACHTHEMERLIALRESDPATQQKGVDMVWENFETRAAMIETLAASLTPDHAGRVRAPAVNAAHVYEPQPLAQTESQENIIHQPLAEAAYPLEQPSDHSAAPDYDLSVQTAQDITPPPAEPQSYNTAPIHHEQGAAQAPIQTSGNPMAMFAKPRLEEQPAQELPPVAPSAPIPPPEPEAAAPIQPTPVQSVENNEPAPANNNPMTFFKTPPQDEGTE